MGVEKLPTYSGTRFQIFSRWLSPGQPIKPGSHTPAKRFLERWHTMIRVRWHPQHRIDGSFKSVENYLSDRQNNNFNAIRMLAAFAVLAGHAWPLTGHEPPVLIHAYGVWAFFALSGYLITASMGRRDPIDYIVARALRILPALVVCVTLTVLVLGPLITTTPDVYFQHPFTRQFWLWNISLIKDVQFLPGVFLDNPYPGVVNGSLWTIPWEVRCYIIVLCCGLLGRLQLVPFVVATWIVARDEFDHKSLMLASFALGSALYSFAAKPRLLWLLVFSALSCLDEIFLVPALALGVLYLGQLDGPWIAYNKIGDYSYGLYLWAFPVQQIVSSFGVTSPWVNIIVATPLTLVLAVLSWHLVERRPLARKIRRERPERDILSAS